MFKFWILMILSISQIAWANPGVPSSSVEVLRNLNQSMISQGYGANFRELLTQIESEFRLTHFQGRRLVAIITQNPTDEVFTASIRSVEAHLSALPQNGSLVSGVGSTPVGDIRKVEKLADRILARISELLKLDASGKIPTTLSPFQRALSSELLSEVNKVVLVTHFSHRLLSTTVQLARGVVVSLIIAGAASVLFADLASAQTTLGQKVASVAGTALCVPVSVGLTTDFCQEMRSASHLPENIEKVLSEPYLEQARSRAAQRQMILKINAEYEQTSKKPD